MVADFSLGYIEPMSKEVLIQGEVVSGRKLGKKIGFPTVNIVYKGDVSGIFVGEILLDGKWLQAVIHIGKKPTIQDDEVTLEAHILNWTGDVKTGTIVSVKLLKKIRDTKKFEDLKQLEKAIEKDVEFARNWYNLGDSVIKTK